MANLKPCPFCGGEGRLDHTGCGSSIGSRVVCLQCFCKTNNFRISVSESSDKRAIEAWNTRVGE